MHVLSAAADGVFEPVVPVDVVQEVFTVVARRGERELAGSMATDIARRYRVAGATKETLRRALGILAGDVTILGVDGLVLATADEESADYVVSRDRDLGKLAGDRWIDPSDGDALLRLVTPDQ